MAKEANWSGGQDLKTEAKSMSPRPRWRPNNEVTNLSYVQYQIYKRKFLKVVRVHQDLLGLIVWSPTQAVECAVIFDSLWLVDGSRCRRFLLSSSVRSIRVSASRLHRWCSDGRRSSSSSCLPFPAWCCCRCCSSVSAVPCR